MTLAALAIPASPDAASGRSVNRIVAVVEDGVILESELDRRVTEVEKQLQSQNTPLPPGHIMRRQILERMILNKLQRQMATQLGIQVDDETLRRSMNELAQRNDLSLEEFRKVLQDEGINYRDFVETMRDELIINRLRSRQVNSQIKVTEREVEQYLSTQGEHGDEENAEFHLGHILVATPDGAASSQIQKAKTKADELVEKLRGGADFKQTAISQSDGAQALNGGDLGWRKVAQIPTMFVESVVKMKPGEIQGPIRSASGFHIIKLLELKGSGKRRTTQTQVRHILLKPNELLTDEDSMKRLMQLKERIQAGDDFAVLARAHSDDKTSALKGGDLGWVSPGDLLPTFEEAMNGLAIGAISDPVQTQFGWHLIQVLDRQERDSTADYKKEQAREEIRKRKIEEETGLWLRRLRDEAYVEIRLEDS